MGRFCISCKYCRRVGSVYMCSYEYSGMKNLVTGELVSTCESTRNDMTKCGEFGKWFEGSQQSIDLMSLRDMIIAKQDGSIAMNV